MSARVDDLLRDYLDRLRAAAADLPPDRRADLLDGIAEHIDGARAAGAAADEAAVRTLLDRLGSPETIVAAARDDEPGAPVVLQPRGTGRELTAVLLLTAGSLLPLVGWLAGVAVLWTSPLWRVREKLLGTLVLPLGPGGALFLGGLLPFLTSTETCVQAVEGSDPGGVVCTSSGSTAPVLPLVLLYLLLPVLVAVLLYRTAVRRAAEQGPLQARRDRSPWGGLEVAGVLLLGLGGLLLPVVPSVAGLALVLASRRWTGREKAVGTALAALPLLVTGGLVAAAYLSNGAVLLGPLELGLLGGYLSLLLGPALSAVYLGVVLNRRP